MLYNLIYHCAGDPPRSFVFQSYTEAAAAFTRICNTLDKTCMHYNTSISAGCSQAIYLKGGATRVVTLVRLEIGMSDADWNSLKLD